VAPPGNQAQTEKSNLKLLHSSKTVYLTRFIIVVKLFIKKDVTI
jgi:hypothetical protein